MRDENGKFYLATVDTQENNIKGAALAWDKLAKIFAKSKARISIFLDACHSGAAGSDSSIYATNDQATSSELASIPAGVVVFSASRGRELSREQAGKGGYFTQAIAKVLSGNRPAFDTNKNGRIEISELYYGVKAEVVKRTSGKQTPWLARNQMVGDYALF